MRVGLAVVAAILLVLGLSSVGMLGTRSSLLATPNKSTGVGQNFGIAGGLYIKPLSEPSKMPPTGTANYVFQISSGVNGVFAFSIAPQGESITPPQILNGTNSVPSFHLPSYITVQFPGGNVIQATNNATVTVVVSTHGAPTGQIPLELVVFQQQSPVLVAETAIPFIITVG